MKTALWIGAGVGATILFFMYVYPRIKAQVKAKEIADVKTGVEQQIGAFALNEGESLLKKVGGALGV